MNKKTEDFMNKDFDNVRNYSTGKIEMKFDL